MRLPLAFAFCASLCLTAPVRAQSASPPDAGPGPGAPGAGADGGGKSNKMQELIQGCRQQARSQGLTPQTHEMRQAVKDCVVRQKPGMARIMGCRMEGMDKGLKPGDELRSFVKDCMKRG